MQLFHQAAQTARFEAGLFRRFPRLVWAAVAICVVPALYAFIYLESVWDPASRTERLPALIVNLDRGTQVGDTEIAIGDDLTASLKAGHAFGFEESSDAQSAKAAVRAGEALFALIIPSDFSEQAMAAERPGSGRLVVFASEGNNYAGAGFARRFAAELGRQLNETISERRWAAVLGASASSGERLERLRDGISRLRQGSVELRQGLQQAQDGAQQVAQGATRLVGGVGQLSDGYRQIAHGVRTLDTNRPAEADLSNLRQGAALLAQGHLEFSSSLSRLEAGAAGLVEGARQLRDEADGVPLVGSLLSAGPARLAEGAVQLQDGLSRAGAAQARLSSGSMVLSQGVGQWADGMGQYMAGVSQLAQRMPPEARVDELAYAGQALLPATTQLGRGLSTLSSGARDMSIGLDALASALPARTGNTHGNPSGTITGTPGGLASPVEPEMQIDAPVLSNGMGFVPNFIPVALWLGAVMTAFILHLRRLPVQVQAFHPAAQLAGKMGILGTLNMAQVACVLLMCEVLLGMRPVHAVGLAVSMMVMSLTFMLVIMMLVRLAGDLGKGAALILLIVQLSSAGGIVPIEVTNDFYRTVSPWLPFTWAVKAVRASAFGAFNDDWVTSVAMLAGFGIMAASVCIWLGRWNFVNTEEHRPAIDI